MSLYPAQHKQSSVPTSSLEATLTSLTLLSLRRLLPTVRSLFQLLPFLEMRLCILFGVFIAAVAGDNLFRSPEAFKRHIVVRQTSCSSDQVSCSFGGCCDKNSTCVVVNNIGGCCPIGVNCGQSSGSSSSQKAGTTTNAVATTSQAAVATTSAAQNGCASGFISCNDGTGGCCPAGSQVSSLF